MSQVPMHEFKMLDLVTCIPNSFPVFPFDFIQEPIIIIIVRFVPAHDLSSTASVSVYAGGKVVVVVGSSASAMENRAFFSNRGQYYVVKLMLVIRRSRNVEEVAAAYCRFFFIFFRASISPPRMIKGFF